MKNKRYRRTVLDERKLRTDNQMQQVLLGHGRKKKTALRDNIGAGGKF